MMGNKKEARANSPQRSPSPKESLLPRTSSSHKLQDKVTALRSGKPAEKLLIDQHAKGQAKTSKVFVRADRPYKEGKSVEELVKYMSEVPAYLQLLENKGDTTTNQEKALNIGVLDWGNLQNWTDKHKVVAGMKDPYSSSGRRVMSACRTNGISTGQMKRSPSPTPDWNQVLPAKEEANIAQRKNSRMFASFLNLDTAALGISMGLPQLKATPPSVCDKVEQQVRNISFAASRSTVSGDQCCSQEIDTFRSPVIGRGMSRFPELKESDAGNEFYNGNFEPSDHKRKKCPDRAVCNLELPKHCSTGTMASADGRQSAENLNIVRVQSSVESNDDPPAASYDKFSESLLLEDFRYDSQCSGIPHSCPLPCSIEDSELTDSGIEIFRFSQGEVHGLTYTPVREHITDTPLHADEKKIRMRGGFEEFHNTRAMLPTLFTDETPKRVFKIVTEAVTPCTQRSQSCHPHGNRMIRSSSLKGILDVKQVMMDGHLDNNIADKGRSNSRGRRSPLRRLLDPILKPRTSERCCGEVTESPVTIVRRLSFADKPSSQVQKHVRRCLNPSPEACLNSTTDQDKSKLRPPIHDASYANAVTQSEKHKSSRRQALVRLAWKNELPLFTFSMNDTDILVATRKGTFAAKTDIKSCYTFYYVNELKKKSGGWINQGNKKQELVSKVVGKMYVSSRHSSSSPTGKDSVTDSGSSNFVLVGPELRPTASQSSQILPDSELAAVIVHSLNASMSSTGVDCTPCVSDERVSSHATHSTDECSSSAADTCSLDSASSSCFKVVAILPNEVHGLSNSGAPSSLIDRWESGGSCDCGGWDVGCSLTVLAENVHESSKTGIEKTPSSSDGTHRAELFIQGGGVKESRPSFSLVVFKEGLYTVEFDSSIAALQAFALCITLVHCQRPSSHPRVQNFPSQLLPSEGSLSRVSMSTHGEETTASYMPNHPPLSPVGRA